MKKRILSILCSLAILFTVTTVSALDVNASESEQKIVDGSVLTTEESSTGYSSSPNERGVYLMTGECTISKAGLTRVYAYASTTANKEVDYIATLVYVERYMRKKTDGDKLTGGSQRHIMTISFPLQKLLKLIEDIIIECGLII